MLDDPVRIYLKGVSGDSGLGYVMAKLLSHQIHKQNGPHFVHRKGWSMSWVSANYFWHIV